MINANEPFRFVIALIEFRNYCGIPHESERPVNGRNRGSWESAHCERVNGDLGDELPSF